MSTDVFLEEIDTFREWEHGRVTGEDDSDCGDDNEEWFHVTGDFLCGWGSSEEGHAEIYENEILGELGEG